MTHTPVTAANDDDTIASSSSSPSVMETGRERERENHFYGSRPPLSPQEYLDPSPMYHPPPSSSYTHHPSGSASSPKPNSSSPTPFPLPLPLPLQLPRNGFTTPRPRHPSFSRITQSLLGSRFWCPWSFGPRIVALVRRVVLGCAWIRWPSTDEIENASASARGGGNMRRNLRAPPGRTIGGSISCYCCLLTNRFRLTSPVLVRRSVSVPFS
jgi:hypothetical protein